MTKAVIGLFDNAPEAHDAVRELIDAGFDRDAIGFAALDRGDTPGTVEVASEGDNIDGSLDFRANPFDLLGPAPRRSMDPRERTV